MESTRDSWSGTFGFVLAAVGSAVGLGNIWRFPYIAGEFGGAAFILVYLACVAAVGIPIMIAELLIGRSSQLNIVGAFQKLRPATPWFLTGWIGVATGFVLLSYYSVVGGWVLHYISLALVNAFDGQSPLAVKQLFTTLSDNKLLQAFRHASFMAITILFVSRGIPRGIEIANKVMMPALFLMLCFLCVYALRTDGASAGLAFLLTPDWDKIGPRAILEALGQAFFSLSVGMGTLVTYGSYLRQNSHLPRAACMVATSDTLIAILAGLVIFPLVFTFGFAPNNGPALVFETLPAAFGQLPFGQFLALVFFLLLTFAALSSAMPLLEVVVAYFVDEKKWNRRRASWLVGSLIFLAGVPSAADGAFFTIADMLTTNVLLPIGGLLVALFVGWTLTPDERRSQIPRAVLADRNYHGWLVLVRFVAPIAVTIILLRLLISEIFSG